MKNRAKCKICNTIIESFHSLDHVQCKCGEIMVYGGDSLKCSAIEWSNFLRVDDQGNEIVVTVKDDVNPLDIPKNKPGIKELHQMLNEMIRNIENLPQHAAIEPITHYDFASALLLVSELFKALDDA